jgi:hypothetical protein
MPILLRPPQTYLSEPIQVLDSVRIRQYFQDYGEEELLQVRRFWQLHSRRKELWDFGSRRSKVRYSFDNFSKKYYRQIQGQARRVVPNRSIKMDIMRFSSGICSVQRELAQLLISERISVQDWYTGTTRLMKYSYRAAIDIARGFSGPMSIPEEQEFLRITAEEVSRFNLYARQLAGGSVPVDGKVLNAVCSLGRRINRIFENWKLWDAKRSGFVQARRRLTVAEHCRDNEHRHGCVELARMGWQPIDTIVPIGEAVCWDGCLCEMEYR